MKNIYFLLSMLVVLAGACIDNNSDLGTNEISRIKFKTKFDETAYRADRWSEFALDCPEIIQENEEKPLTYRWDINYKTVSTEKDLRFICDELTTADQGSFPCRLTVSNEDGSSWLDFRLTVTSPYQEGLLIMSKVEDGSMFSFKREDKENQEFQLNAYKLNNPDFPLGSEPKDVVQVESFLYIGTENPNRIVKVNSQTMEAVSLLDYPGEHLDFMSVPGTATYTIYCFDHGREIELDGSQDAFMNAYQQAIDNVYPGIVLANHAIAVGWSTFVYNDTDGALLDIASLASYFPDEFTGKKLVDMVSCKDSEEMLVIVQAEGEVPEIVYLNPGNNVHYSTVSTQGTGITDESVFVASQQYSRLYYSVGNEIYVYDYSTGGNFPAVSSYTVGNAGDVIKAMVLTEEDSKLYVAWESAAGGELKGNAKCFVLSGDSEEWEAHGIAGDIVRMIYKL